MTIDDGALPSRDPWGAPVGTPPAVAMPLDQALPDESAPEESSVEPSQEPRRPWPLGYLAFGIAVLLVVAEAIAVYLGSNDEPIAATVIGQILVVITAFPFALGLLAVLRNRNREWGIAAMVLAIIANPFILINVLGFFGAF